MISFYHVPENHLSFISLYLISSTPIGRICQTFKTNTTTDSRSVVFHNFGRRKLFWLVIGEKRSTFEPFRGQRQYF